jgi:hypothetical protein
MRPRAKPRKNFVLFSFFISLSLLSYSLVSNASDLRVSCDLGFGGVGVSNTNGYQRNQGPLLFSLGIDYTYDSRIAFGAEHRRTYSNIGSAVGITNLLTRWYFYTPQPQSVPDPDKTSLTQKTISPYLMGALGMMQATIPTRNAAIEPDVNLVGLTLTGGPCPSFS